MDEEEEKLQKELEEKEAAAKEEAGTDADAQEEDKFAKTERLFKQYEEGMQGKASALEQAAKARLAAAPAGVAAALGTQVPGAGMVGGGQLRQAASAAESAGKVAALESGQLEAQAAQARADAAMGIQEAGVVAGEASQAMIDDMNTELDNTINEAIAANKGTWNDDEDAMYNAIDQHLQQYADQMGGRAKDFPMYENLSPGDPDPKNPAKKVTAEQIAIAKMLRKGYKRANDIKYKREDV
jgi:hypothetical protein